MAYHTGATFYPGGDDSYYIPEVVSPQPQRIAELPANMQENVAHMEQQASWKSPHLSMSQPSSSYGPTTGNPWSPTSPVGQPQMQGNLYNNTNTVDSGSGTYQKSQYQTTQTELEQPNFSPFPALRNRGPNVPPSDDDREATLEAAREAVLRSSDFEMQLTWAQDALAYVEIAIQNELNVAITQGPRSRTPRIEHVLKEDAMKVVEFLADQRHPRAEFVRGTWLEFGKFGNRVDKKEAYNCYIRASDRGYARAYYRIGMQFEASNDALKAIKYYQMGVGAGDPAACYRLGMMTLLGQHGQMKDYGRGLSLINISAQKADDNAPQGAYVLGMLQAGELQQVQIPEHILPRDIVQAKANIEKAAFLGFAKAQVRMGQAYELGDLGCSFDPTLSLHYNNLASRQGEAEAQMAISKWFLCGHEGLFSQNEELAFTYAQRAAVSGLPTAQFAMGYFYEVGIYVKLDLKQAREWYQKADENGNTDARKRIEAVSRSKTISRRDHESVSLQRIRQQHAAAAGGPTLPSVSESSYTPNQSQNPTLTMPDPSRLSISESAPQRPTSTAPYPTNNLSVNQPNPNVRPSSAFGVNPRLQQQSNQYQNPGSGQGDPYRRSSGPNYPVDRPHSGMDVQAPGPGYGRGNRVNPGPPQNQNYPPQQQQQRLAQPRPGPNAPYGGGQSKQTSPRPPQPPQSPPQGADIGFSAPPDPRSDRQRRPLPSQQQPQRPSGSASNTSYNGSQSGTPRPQQQQPQPQPQQQKPYQKPQPPAPGPGPQNKPPPQSNYNNNNIQAANLAPTKPIAAPPTPRPDQQKPNKVAASTASSKPPGKGPKTFEEMGVPQAKKEEDCIVM